MIEQLLPLLSQRVLLGLLVGARVTGLISVGPVFGAHQVPPRVRAGLVVALTVFLTPIVAATGAARSAGSPVSHSPALFVPALFSELALGLLSGFACSLLLEAARLAGAAANVQMSLGAAHLFDPTAGEQSPFVGQLYYMVATLVFLEINGHHWLISAVATSYAHIPLGGAVWRSVLADGMVGALGMVFEMALRLAAPALGALFLTDLGLGLLSRAVPQMNVFIVGIPGKIMVGILVLALAAPSVVGALASLLGDSRGLLAGLLRALSP